MLFFSLSILFKTTVSLNDINDIVSYYLYLYLNLNPYKLVSVIAKKRGDTAIVLNKLNVL
jgi:hypothetical protein